ncbi:hypothetical protein GCM10020256_73800 [Streptomyces thermocoprophilus]
MEDHLAVRLGAGDLVLVEEGPALRQGGGQRHRRVDRLADDLDGHQRYGDAVGAQFVRAGGLRADEHVGAVAHGEVERGEGDGCGEGDAVLRDLVQGQAVVGPGEPEPQGAEGGRGDEPPALHLAGAHPERGVDRAVDGEDGSDAVEPVAGGEGGHLAVLGLQFVDAHDDVVGGADLGDLVDVALDDDDPGHAAGDLLGEGAVQVGGGTSRCPPGGRAVRR